MLKFLTELQSDQFKSLGRSAGIVVATVLATLALIPPESHDLLISAFSDMWEGIRLFAKGMYVAVPILLTAWGVYKASHRQQMKTVMAASPAERVAAVADAKPVEILQAAAQLPSTEKIVNPLLAAETPSPKVVSE